MSNNSKAPVIAVGLVATISLGVILYFATQSKEPSPVIQSDDRPGDITKEQIAQDAEAAGKASMVDAPPMPAVEVHFFEEEPVVETNSSHPLLRSKKPNRIIDASLDNLRQIVESDAEGGFMNPQLSPDGLQIMLTRAGYDGVYLVPSSGGVPEKILGENAWGAKWTSDGRIRIEDREGEVKYFTADGLLESVEHITEADKSSYSQDDMIYFRSEAGAAAKPLTDNNDRYITPEESPNGDQITFYGLYSGLYAASTDGSGEPVFLGNGDNVQWKNDGSGFIYDQTTDDGHSMVQGDIYYYDVNSGDVHNLTSDIDLIGVNPTIGGNGRDVAFEVDGGIFMGDIP